MDIDQLEVELDSRDDIPQLLQGLQSIFLTPTWRQEVFAILEGRLPPELDLDHGRPGMAVGSIFVRGVVRLSLNGDDDRLHNWVHNPLTLRPLWGQGGVDERKHYQVQTLQDNVARWTPEILDPVNRAVVRAGHEWIKKKDWKTVSHPGQIKGLRSRSRAAVMLL